MDGNCCPQWLAGLAWEINATIRRPDARADSIPSLKISTDEVKCSHGSTTGKLDPNQLFYLETRGFGKDEARELLVQGYFEDIVAQCPESVADAMRKLISGRIAVSDE